MGRVKSRDNGKRQKWDSLRPLLKKFASNGHTEHLPFKVVSGIIRQLRQVKRMLWKIHVVTPKSLRRSILAGDGLQGGGKGARRWRHHLHPNGGDAVNELE